MKTFKSACLFFLTLTVAGCGKDDDHGDDFPISQDKFDADKGYHDPATNHVHTAYGSTNIYPASSYYSRKFLTKIADTPTKTDSSHLIYSREMQRKNCRSNMKRLQNAVKLYMLNHGSMPSIYDLCGPGKYLRTEPTCPKDGRPYSFFREAGEIKVTCPNADEYHKL